MQGQVSAYYLTVPDGVEYYIELSCPVFIRLLGGNINLKR